MDGIKLILNDKGQVAGWHDYINGQCVAAEEKKPSVGKEELWAEAKKAAVTKVGSKAEAEGSWLDKTLRFLAFSDKPSGAAGCGSDATRVEETIGDDGVVLIPPVTELEPNEFGFIETPEGIILPDAVLPATAFDLAGEGGKYQTTPEILYESPVLVGKDIQNLSLYVELGTDSTGITTEVVLTDPDLGIDLSGQRIDINEDGVIDIDDSDGNGVETYTLPGDACYPGLVNMTPLSAGALSLNQAEREAYGLEGCADPDYLPLANCPSQDTKRIKLYLGSYTLERYTYAGLDGNGNPKYEPTGETVTETLTTVDGAHNGIGQELGVVCDGTPAGYQFNIPSGWHSDGTLFVKLKLTVIAAAKDLPSDYANNYYKTKLYAIIRKSEGEE